MWNALSNRIKLNEPYRGFNRFARTVDISSHLSLERFSPVTMVYLLYRVQVYHTLLRAVIGLLILGAAHAAISDIIYRFDILILNFPKEVFFWYCTFISFTCLDVLGNHDYGSVTDPETDTKRCNTYQEAIFGRILRPYYTFAPKWNKALPKRPSSLVLSVFRQTSFQY